MTRLNIWYINEYAPVHERHHYVGQVAATAVAGQLDRFMHAINEPHRSIFAFSHGKGPNDRYRTPAHSKFYLRCESHNLETLMRLFILICGTLETLPGNVGCCRIWRRNENTILIEIGFNKLQDADLLQQELNMMSLDQHWYSRFDTRVIKPDGLVPRRVNRGGIPYGGPILI